jgi:hypothetical protein
MDAAPTADRDGRRELGVTTAQSSTHFGLLLGYGAAVAVWALAAMLMSPVAGLHLGLTTLALCLALPAMARLNEQRNWPRFVGEWLTPLMLWFTFGLGSIPTFLRVERMAFYGPYEDIAVQTFGFYVFVGAVAYVLCFRLSYTAARGGTWVDSHQLARTDKVNRVSRTIPFVAALIAFDWYTRLDQIRQGVYFEWLRSLANAPGHRGANLIYHLHDTFSWILLALLVYLAVESKKGRTLFGSLIVFQLLLPALTGSRRLFLIAVAVVGFSYLYLSGQRITRKLTIVTIASVVLFFGVVSPGVEAARLLMRSEGRTLSRDPLTIPWLFLTRYLPGAMGLREEQSYERQMVMRQGVVARVGGYMAYGASVNQALIDERRPLRSWDELGTRLASIVPRVLYSSKKDVTAGADLLQYFRLGRRGMDPNGSHVVDVFSFLHAPGIVLLLGLGGAFYGLATRFLLNRFGKVGGLVVIGSMPVFLPYADSFTAYLTGMRNTLIVIVVVSLVFFGKERWRASPRTAALRSRSPGPSLGTPATPSVEPQTENTW